MLDEAPIIDLHSDAYFMGQALREAHKARAAGEVPVGAVVTYEGRIIARAWNQVETLKDATAHAEMLAITQAESVIGDWRLHECELYVTKEPCPMCAGALVHVRMKRVIFGCSAAKDGAFVIGGVAATNFIARRIPLGNGSVPVEALKKVAVGVALSMAVGKAMGRAAGEKVMVGAIVAVGMDLLRNVPVIGTSLAGDADLSFIRRTMSGYPTSLSSGMGAYDMPAQAPVGALSSYL